MHKMLTYEGVQLYMELLYHFLRRFDIVPAMRKAMYVLDTFYGDVAYEVV